MAQTLFQPSFGALPTRVVVYTPPYPLLVYTIPHHLHHYPSPTIRDPSTGEEMYPAIEHPDVDTTIVRWTTPTLATVTLK